MPAAEVAACRQRGLHLQPVHRRVLLVLVRLQPLRLDLRLVALPVPPVEAEPVSPGAVASDVPVPQLLVVLVAAAVVRPAPQSSVRTRRPSSVRWRACTRSGSYVS